MERRMQLHELHPALVHLPLVLLPAAAISDAVAVISGKKSWDLMGRRLWLAGSASALAAGVAGLAASQEVRIQDPRARDMTVLHGLGNLVVTASALVLSAWRRNRKASVLSAGVGLASMALASITATLGGKMVYEYGVGVRPMPFDAPQGVRRAPPLLSKEAPVALVKDAIGGLRWLAQRRSRSADIVHPQG